MIPNPNPTRHVGQCNAHASSSVSCTRPSLSQALCMLPEGGKVACAPCAR